MQVDVLRDEYEGRVFEDPLYLMQYTINWEDTNAAAAFQSPENDAFLNAENEGYLKKVAHTRLPSVRSRSGDRLLAVRLTYSLGGQK